MYSRSFHENFKFLEQINYFRYNIFTFFKFSKYNESRLLSSRVKLLQNATLCVRDRDVHKQWYETKFFFSFSFTSSESLMLRIHQKFIAQALARARNTHMLIRQIVLYTIKNNISFYELLQLTIDIKVTIHEHSVVLLLIHVIKKDRALSNDSMQLAL